MSGTEPTPNPSDEPSVTHPATGPPQVLKDEERAAIRAAVLAMPPLTDAQVEAVVALLAVLRDQRRGNASR